MAKESFNDFNTKTREKNAEKERKKKEKQNRRRSPRFKSQQGGWDSNKASNMYQKMLMELKQYINDYTKGLYAQSGNFDDQILKLIINPNDSEPYSDNISDVSQEIGDTIKQGLNMILQDANVNGKNIQEKINELRKLVTILKENEKKLMSYYTNDIQHITDGKKRIIWI